MKLLILAGEFPPFRGGIGTYAREIAEAATDLGFEVTAAGPSYNNSLPDLEALDSQYPFRTLRFSGGAHSGKSLLAKIAWLHHLAQRERFDAVHATDWAFYIPLALSPFRRRSKCLITFHGSEINWISRRSRALALNAIRFWDGWALSIANSHFTGKYLQEKCPSQLPERLRVVPLGVRSSSLLERFDRTDARAELNIERQDFLILTLGRVVPRKGHHILAQALANIPEEMRDRAIWYIVGPEHDAEYARDVRAAAARSGVRSIFTGGLSEPDLERVFAAADILCVPSIWGPTGEFEGFGLVYLEAGLRGVPSIATRIGGIPDAVIDGDTGLLIEAEDVPALARALIRLWQDEALRTRLGSAAKDHALKATWTRVAEQTYSG